MQQKKIVRNIKRMYLAIRSLSYIHQNGVKRIKNEVWWVFGIFSAKKNMQLMRYAHTCILLLLCIHILQQYFINRSSKKKLVQGYRKKNRGLTLKYLMVIPIFQGKIVWTTSKYYRYRVSRIWGEYKYKQVALCSDQSLLEKFSRKWV